MQRVDRDEERAAVRLERLPAASAPPRRRRLSGSTASSPPAPSEPSEPYASSAPRRRRRHRLPEPTRVSQHGRGRLARRSPRRAARGASSTGSAWRPTAPPRPLYPSSARTTAGSASGPKGRRTSAAAPPLTSPGSQAAATNLRSAAFCASAPGTESTAAYARRTSRRGRAEYWRRFAQSRAASRPGARPVLRVRRLNLARAPPWPPPSQRRRPASTRAARRRASGSRSTRRRRMRSNVGSASAEDRRSGGDRRVRPNAPRGPRRGRTVDAPARRAAAAATTRRQRRRRGGDSKRHLAAAAAAREHGSLRRRTTVEGLLRAPSSSLEPLQTEEAGARFFFPRRRPRSPEVRLEKQAHARASPDDTEPGPSPTVRYCVGGAPRLLEHPPERGEFPAGVLLPPGRADATARRRRRLDASTPLTPSTTPAQSARTRTRQSRRPPASPCTVRRSV